MLSHYRLVEKIGEGGMGVVWKGEDTVLNRPVALKFLPEAFARDAEHVSRFQREARLLASLNHPNIAAIHGLEEAGGERFLVLELVPGISLAERLKKGPLPVDNALKVCSEIVKALEAAHEKGVIHRDLKPGNVQLTPKGTIKLLDFGLAKAFDVAMAPVDASQQVTASIATGQPTIVGTTPYLSPEQACGKPVDKRTDIWAFGCVLYEALTGQRTFSDPTVSGTIAAILSREPDWDRLPTRTPTEARKLLRRCLEKDPNRRLHDIADARIEIDEMLTGGTEPDPSASQRTAPGFGVVAWIATGVAFLLAAALVYDTLTERARDAGTALVLQDLRRVTSLPGNETQPSLSPDGQFVAFVSKLHGNKDLWVKSIAGGEAVQITDDRADDYDPDWSPDGSTIVFRSDRGNTGLYTVSAFGGDETRISDFGYRPRWSPDSKSVLFQLRPGTFIPNEIFVLEHPPRQPARILLSWEAGKDPFHSADWSPDGRHVVCTTGHYVAGVGIAISSPIRGTPATFLEWQGNKVDGGNAIWTGDGRGIVFSVDKRGLWYVPLDRGLHAASEPLRLTTGKDDFPAISQDGKRLAYNSVHANSDIWKVPLDPATGRSIGPATRFINHPADESSPAILPGERGLVFISDRAGTPCLYVADMRGENVRLVEKTHHWSGPIAVSPDGKWIVATTHQVTVQRYMIPFDLRTLQALGPPRKFEPQSSGSWTADSRYLVLSGETRWGIRALDVASSDSLQQVSWPLNPDFAEQYPRLIFPSSSPDGKWIAFGAYKERNKPAIFIVEIGSDAPQLIWEGSGFARWMEDSERIYIWSEREDETRGRLGFVRIDPSSGAPVERFTTVVLEQTVGAFQCSMTKDRESMLCVLEEDEGDIYVADIR